MEIPPLQRNGARAEWVDIAKAVSITLVVFWHVAGDRFAISEALLFLRMPLFFFLAGLFLRSKFRVGQESAFGYRSANFLYLYSLWSVILFVLVFLPPSLMAGKPHPFTPLLTFLVDPLNTVWFIYALFWGTLAIFLLRRVPIWITLSAALLLYGWSVSDGSWREVAFYERVVRLFPFLLVGLVSYEACDRLGQRYAGYWPAVIVLYFLIAFPVYFSDLSGNTLATLTASIVGIAGVILFGHWMSRQDFKAVFLFVGSSSLFIYLMHRIVIFAMEAVLHLADVKGTPDTGGAYLYLYMVAGLVLGVFVPAWLGTWLAGKSWAGWLFALPTREASRQRVA